jgi:hypothetical protein
MTLALYDVSVNALIRGLTTLGGLLDKAGKHAAAKKFDPQVLVQARLFPDMHPLVRQVQIACDTAKGAAARLASLEVPKHEDTEMTLDELKQRVAKTVEFLKSVRPDQVNGPVDRGIELTFPNGAMKFTATSYVVDFVLPNFYFHESMVYALLRSNGVEVGKSDFLGTLP